MLVPVRVSAPAVPVVTVAEMVEHARTNAEDNALVEAYIDAATAHLDGYTGILGRCLINQGWQVGLCAWPTNGSIVPLPFPDVSAATVTWSDGDDAEQTVDGDLVEIFPTARGSALRLRGAFTAPALFEDRVDPLRITFTAGFGDTASAVPSPLRVAIMMLAAHWYENREAVNNNLVTTMPLGVDRLIEPYRRPRV